MVEMARITLMAVAEPEKKGNSRVSRKTPAATMVAECSRAETGVGPSMASGSQTCSGNWALLPMMPQKIRRAEVVRSQGGMDLATAAPFTEAMSRLP